MTNLKKKLEKAFIHILTWALHKYRKSVAGEKLYFNIIQRFIQNSFYFLYEMQTFLSSDVNEGIVDQVKVAE